MEDPISLTIKAKGKNKSGLRVELREDGHYYISKCPRGMKDCSVGDRVLEINGADFSRFKNENHANELIDSFQLRIVPVDDDEDDQTTDDDLDLDVDDIPSPSAARSAGPASKPSPSKSETANKASNRGVARKKGPGRRENVEYLNESDSDGDEEEEEEVLRESKVGSKGRTDRAGAGAGAAAAKAPTRKGPGRREEVEYIDEDEDDDEDDEDDTINDNDMISNTRQGAEHSEKGLGHREEVEYIEDDEGDDESSDEESYEEVVRPPPLSGVQPSNKAAGKPVRQSVRTVNDEDDSDSSEYEEVTRQHPSQLQHEEEMSGNGEAEDDEDSETAYDSDEEYDEEYDELRKPISENSLKHSMARRKDSKRSLHRPSPKAFDRPYTSDYVPMDRWMVTVKKEPNEDIGISLVQHKKELFVADVEQGPFYKTAVDKGDKILSINGKKVPKNIKTVTDAEEIMEGRTNLTVFILRPDPEKDLGYKWVLDNF